MKKNVRKGVFIGGGILMVLIVLMLTIPLFFKDKIKDTVINKANDRLNAELFIKDFGISMFSNFPNITLSLEDMSVTGIGGFVGDTLVKAKSANITFSLWEMLKGNYAVSRINMDKAEIYAKVLADGRVNWDIMKADSIPAESASDTNDTASKGFKLQLQKISLDHCKLIYEDQSSNIKVSLSDWSGEVSGDFTEQNTTLKTKSTIGEVSFTMDGIPYLSKIKGLADATVDVDMDKIKLTFVESNIQLNDVKASLDGTFAFVGVDGKDFDLKLKAPDTQFKDILSILPALYTNDFKDLKTAGTASLEGYVKGLMQGDQYPAFDFKILIKDAMFKYPSLPKSVDNINVAMGISSKGGDLDNLVVDVSKFDFSMGGNPFSASLNIQTPMSDANLKAKIKGVIDLSMIKEVYPLEKGTDMNGKLSANLNIGARMSAIEKEQYQNIEASGSLSINNMLYKSTDSQPVLINNAGLEFSPRYVNLSSMDIKIGNNDLSANGRLENFIAYMLKNKTLKGQLHLRSNYFNLNDFMKPEDQNSSSGKATAASKESGKTSNTETSASSADFQVPVNIDFALDADMKHIVYGKTNITNLKGAITVKDGIVKMQNVSANALGGLAKVSGIYNTADNPSNPKVDLSLNITKASFAETFKSVESVQKFAPIFENILGNFSMDINLNTTMGNNISQMLGNLSADGLIQSNEVKVQNVEVLNELALALKSNSLKSITARDLNIPFSVKDGKINTKPFNIKIGEGGKLNLEGITGLDQTINYKGSVTLPQNMSNSFTNTVPFTISGTFGKPKIAVDTKSLLGNIAGQLLGGGNKEKAEDISSKVSQNKQEQINKIRSEAKAASDKIIEEAQKGGQQLIDAAAPKGAIVKLAAEKSAAKLNSEAKKNAQKLLDEAEAKVKLLE